MLGRADRIDLRHVIVGRHQVMELPERAVSVTEHQAWSVQCPCCCKLTRGTIPVTMRASVVGERLSAALCLLSSRLHGSRRAAAELLGDVLGAPLSLGSVAAREREMSRALAEDYQQLKAQVRRAPEQGKPERRNPASLEAFGWPSFDLRVVALK